MGKYLFWASSSGHRSPIFCENFLICSFPIVPPMDGWKVVLLL